MATINHLKVIPSEFVKFDSTVTDPDRFVSVRDRQRIMENYNILAARRARQPLITQTFSVANSTMFPPRIKSVLERYESEPIQLVWQAPVRLLPTTQKLEVSLYASISGRTLEVWCAYLGSSNAGAGPLPFESSGYVGVNTAVIAQGSEHTATINVAPGDDREGMLSMFVHGGPTGAALKTGAVINDVGTNWVEVNSSYAPQPNDAITFSPTTSVMPQKIVRVLTVAASTYKCWVSEAWRTQQPVPGVDTASFYAIAPLYVHSLSVYEQAVTAFEAESARL